MDYSAEDILFEPLLIEKWSRNAMLLAKIQRNLKENIQFCTERPCVILAYFDGILLLHVLNKYSLFLYIVDNFEIGTIIFFWESGANV